ncbi:MAG: YggS family pyridoxal phosphate-dependent enzyme [Chloroflexi bacterium]|jgi:pyridoxal phosphate enzyme (YggS family)|nr:YggS family pyridoxal phosphate-dependent enzyme [Anaerolineaceae bacterium]NMB88806.1 YggS family pyridoxal phosphate-dependent enzyme [Chloroflexota bacterium]
MDALVDQIRTRYESILARIDKACAQCSRSPDRVKLVVVSKKQPVEVIQRAIQAGTTRLGENYPEEAQPKIMALGEDCPAGIEWHMIGHLQSRKVRIIVEHFQYFHSLDSLSLAEKLSRQLAEAEKSLPTLLEFNVGAEESKHGWPAWDERHWDDLRPEIEKILQLPCLEVRGLMTMPPYFDDPELARPYFVKVCELRDYLARLYPQAAWDELSMGTSGDFEIAIQEGATFVRVGTAILGPRR